jgi:hypothetical protein
MIAVCVVVILAGGALAFALSGEVKVNEKTGCVETHQAPVAHTVMLVDETDKLSRSELSYAKSLIMNEYYWLPVGGRLTVRNIVADPDVAEDIVICRMDDGSTSLGITSNPRKIRRDFQRIAGTRLEELFTDLRTAPVQKFSPILEYIAGVFDRPDFGTNIRQRRIVILSDMAQHSRVLDQYARVRKRSLNQLLIAEYHRNMRGVEIRIQYVIRPELSRIQGEAHRQFWIQYLQNMGASVALGHSLLIGEEGNRETWSDQS